MKTEIIVEIAQAHDGSLGILHSYIDALSKTGIDTIKFQTHIANAESSLEEPFRVNFSYEDKTRFDYWKRMEFSKKQWLNIKEHCEDVGLNFLSTPFSIEAVELLEDIGIDRYKISSGDVNNYLLLKKVAQTNKPVILSTGMSNKEEIRNAVNYLEKFTSQISIMQCTSMYPTPAQKVGLNTFLELKNEFNYPVGLSDHSGTPYPSFSFVTHGAELIELHGVFHKEMFGPDSKSSLNIDEIYNLVEGIKFIEEMLNNPFDKNSNEFSNMNKIFGKSLALRKDIQKSAIISEEDLECKKPAGCGIDSADFESVIGKKVHKDMKKNSFLNYGDLENA